MGGTPGRRRGLTLAGLLLAALLASRFLVAEPFSVGSDSMLPTLRRGDHVMADKLAYRVARPHRGDLAVLRRPGSGEIVLKRIVALGGDHVEISDGVLIVNGRRPREPYVDRATADSMFFGPVVVPRGRVFVLGDNRAASRDSRSFGAVPTGRLVGRVDAVVWPPRRIAAR